MRCVFRVTPALFLFWGFASTPCARASSAVEDAPLVRDYGRQDLHDLYAPNSSFIPDKSTFLRKSDPRWAELKIPLLLQAIDRTLLGSGSVELENLLQPVSNPTVLARRSEIVRSFIANEAEFNRLELLIREFASYEKDLLSLFDPSARLTVSDEERKAAEASARKSLTWVMPGSVAENIPITPSATTELLTQTFGLVLSCTAIVYQLPHLAFDWNRVRDANAGRFSRLMVLYYGLEVAVGIPTFAWMMTRSFVGIFNKIIDADEFVLRAGQGMDVLVKINALVRDKFPSLAISNAGFYLDEITHPDSDINFFHAQMKARVRASGSMTAWWSALGSPQVYQLMRTYRRAVAKVLFGMATLDAYMSIARLHREWSANGLPVALATHRTEVEIGYRFVGLGNPVIPHPVLNDFALGGDLQARHGVLTGPHACGKTTLMRSLAYGIIMGQSVIVMAANQGEFTPVNDIQISFNIGDDIADGLSSFMAEYQRAAFLKTYAKNMKAGDRVLMLVDEPFSKTMQLVGEPKVMDLVRTLQVTPGLSLVLSTAFPGPAELEAETQGKIKNFQPVVEGDSAATFKQTYRITEGAATWWFENAALREAFVDWLTREKRPSL